MCTYKAWILQIKVISTLQNNKIDQGNNRPRPCCNEVYAFLNRWVLKCDLKIERDLVHFKILGQSN